MPGECSGARICRFSSNVRMATPSTSHVCNRRRANSISTCMAVHETISIDGKPFHPARHFKDHRMEHEKEAARPHEAVIKRLLKEAQVMPQLNAAGVQTFQGGRPWTADNVKKVLQRLKAKR
jgi:hypothetical protein